MTEKDKELKRLELKGILKEARKAVKANLKNPIIYKNNNDDVYEIIGKITDLLYEVDEIETSLEFKHKEREIIEVIKSMSDIGIFYRESVNYRAIPIVAFFILILLLALGTTKLIGDFIGDNNLLYYNIVLVMILGAICQHSISSEIELLKNEYIIIYSNAISLAFNIVLGVIALFMLLVITNQMNNFVIPVDTTVIAFSFGYSNQLIKRF